MSGPPSTTASPSDGVHTPAQAPYPLHRLPTWISKLASFRKEAAATASAGEEPAVSALPATEAPESEIGMPAATLPDGDDEPAAVDASKKRSASEAGLDEPKGGRRGPSAQSHSGPAQAVESEAESSAALTLVALSGPTSSAQASTPTTTSQEADPVSVPVSTSVPKQVPQTVLAPSAYLTHYHHAPTASTSARTAGPSHAPPTTSTAASSSSSSSVIADAIAAATRADRSHTWLLRPELHNTPGHWYRGPLPPARVLELLADPRVSRNGRVSLMGEMGGYLRYMHYLGPSVTPASRKRPMKRGGGTMPAATESDGSAHAVAGPSSSSSASAEASASASTTNMTAATPASASTPPALAPAEDPTLREWWQCRLCHVDLHVPPNQISNLGSHLFGTNIGTTRAPAPADAAASSSSSTTTAPTRRPGCLEMRVDCPAEPVPPPLRDEETGRIVRTHPDKPTAAGRAARRGKVVGGRVKREAGAAGGLEKQVDAGAGTGAGASGQAA